MKPYKKPVSNKTTQDKSKPVSEPTKPVETPPTTYNPTIDD